MWTLLLLPAALATEPAWFYPDEGTTIVEISADSRVSGMPVRRTGAVVAWVQDPSALDGLPRVASWRPLRGDGHVVRIVVNQADDEVAFSRDLWARDDVRWAHPDLALSWVPSALPDDPYLADQWHLANTGQGGWTPGVDIGAEVAWGVSTGSGQIIAVLDTGVQLDHPDLMVIAGHDYVGDDDDPTPDTSDYSGNHGTAVAGLAGATGDNGAGVAGVAYDAEIYAIRFVGEGTTTSDLYDAFVEAVDAGAGVLNNSWGFTDDCTSFPTYASVRWAVEYAEENGRDGLGAVVVSSAGNGACDASGDGFLAIDEVVGVAATDGHDAQEDYSNTGDLIDISGPSGSMLTTDLTGDDGYNSYDADTDYTDVFNGTSASAPVVSGVFALMFAANPELTAAQARQLVCDTAVRNDVDAGGYDSDGWSAVYGCGRIDAGAAVLAAANSLPGAATPVSPVESASVDRVVLQWEPGIDLDGDPVDHTVLWWTDGDQDAAVEVSVATAHLDLTGQVEVGAVVGWTVTPADAWGVGQTATGSDFEVTAAPEPPASPPAETSGACQAAPGSARPAWLVLLGVVGAGLWSRRRTVAPIG